MRLSYLKTGLFAAIVAGCIGAVAFAQGQSQAGQAQGRGQAQVRTPQNLQVLPKDWTIQQVQQQMRGFAAALGVECSHCHVGTMQERFKDDNPKKGIARKMIQLTAAINNDHLKGVGDAPAAGTAKVTCFTCHRGAIKPLNAPGGGGLKP
jgi:hypothetical protein